MRGAEIFVKIRQKQPKMRQLTAELVKKESIMARKAIDIALLPDEAMMEIAIGANAKLVERFGPEIVLDKQKCLPHISLAMGVLEEKNTTVAAKILQSAAREYPVKQLRVAGIYQGVNAVGQIVSAFVVEKTGKLQSLHQAVMRQCEPHLSYEVSADMIYGTGEVAESTLLWIKNYRQKSAFENFSPHITIGYGSTSEAFEFPIEFEVDRLALCHLGNHCTCRDVLESVSI
jgi:hypothetical protein